MRSGHQLQKAGPSLGPPFLLFLAILAGTVFVPAVEQTNTWVFHELTSSCIDLGHYNAKSKELTVRFVNRHTERFYRYSNVSLEIWTKLIALNETGGVGNYFIETVVQNPKKYPFELLKIRSFSTLSKSQKKKAENPK